MALAKPTNDGQIDGVAFQVQKACPAQLVLLASQDLPSMGSSGSKHCWRALEEVLVCADKGPQVAFIQQQPLVRGTRTLQGCCCLQV